MAQFFNSINEVRKNYSKYDDWEQHQADERAQKEYLSSKKQSGLDKDKLELTQKRAEAVIRATEVMDARSEDNCENMEQLTGFITLFPLLGISLSQLPLLNLASKKIEAKFDKEVDKIYKLGLEDSEKATKIKAARAKEQKTLLKANNYIGVGVIAAVLLVGVVSILWGNSKQKEASRIGRYQAKQNELNDLENFVIYTPEQIEKAKEIAKNIPDEKERNAMAKMIRELKEVSKDKKAYKEWLSKKDPDEIEKLKAVELSPLQLQRAEEDKELIVDAVKEINIKAEEYSENVENVFDTFGTLSWIAAIPLGMGVNKVLKALNANKITKNVASVVVPLVTTLGIQIAGTFEQKTASRVGRYRARQDLMKNPARLMAYSDEDMKQAENIKADKQKQGFFKKLGSSFSFIGQYYKDKSEYIKYRKTTRKENEKLYKAFKEIELSDKQKTDAKALQKNVFRAFDEIDEMSQRYSEDTEAACEIAKQLGSSAWELGSMMALALLGVSVMKGKFPIAKIVNKLTNMTFDSNSTIKQAVNNLHSLLQSQGKAKTVEFQKALVGGRIKSFLAKEENAVIKNAVQPLVDEFSKIGVDAMGQMAAGGKDKKATQILSDLFANHFKQTRLAKWTRDMLSQGSKLWMKNKVSKMDTDVPKEVLEAYGLTSEYNQMGILKEAQEALGLNFTYKNYKTLINTCIAAAAPVFGVIFAVPYAFNAWLTNIQKKAGKIGIMKAMDKIDDPRVFASDEPQPVSVEPQPQNTNLLSKYKN